jgi:hypothetical protein
MEETKKLKNEVIDLAHFLGYLRDYEAHDIAIKILALQEQRKAEPLTKREYFAGLALQGILANPTETLCYDENVKNAIQTADKLIQELNKHNQV